MSLQGASEDFMVACLWFAQAERHFCAHMSVYVWEERVCVILCVWWFICHNVGLQHCALQVLIVTARLDSLWVMLLSIRPWCRISVTQYKLFSGPCLERSSCNLPCLRTFVLLKSIQYNAQFNHTLSVSLLCIFFPTVRQVRILSPLLIFLPDKDDCSLSVSCSLNEMEF